MNREILAKLPLGENGSVIMEEIILGSHIVSTCFIRTDWEVRSIERGRVTRRFWRVGRKAHPITLILLIGLADLGALERGDALGKEKRTIASSVYR
jgi:hypothetical protein